MRLNKEWNHKYLSDIESIPDKHLISPLQNIPQKYNLLFWKRIMKWILIGSIVISFVFSWVNHYFECWVCEWLSNLFLNLALGLKASLIVLMFTNRRDQNIDFYSRNLQLFKDRYEKLHTAYHASFGLMMKNISFNRMKEATDDAFNSFECFFCAINFFEFLFKNFKETPYPLNAITKDKIEQAKTDALSLLKEMESKAGSDGVLSKEDLSRVQDNGDIIFLLLNKFCLWINITENELYGTMYGNTENNGIGSHSKEN